MIRTEIAWGHLADRRVNPIRATTFVESGGKNQHWKKCKNKAAKSVSTTLIASGSVVTVLVSYHQADLGLYSYTIIAAKYHKNS